MGLKALDVGGYWWLPYRPKQKFTGTLRFRQQDKQLLLWIGDRFHETKDEKRRFTHDRILGELSNGLHVTLENCLVKKAETYETPSWSSSHSEITAQRILLGTLFQRPKDRIFSRIHVRYYGVGINGWLKDTDMWRNRDFRPLSEARFSIDYRRDDPKEAEDNDNNRYTITLLSKPRRIPPPFTEDREEYSDDVLHIEIGSVNEKPLDDYLEVNRIVRDFLNFIFPQQVTIESVYGIIKAKKVNKKRTSPNQEETAIRILSGDTVSRMFKPDVIKRSIFRPFLNPNASSQDQFQELLCKWFQLSKDPLINLYCGVMFSPEMYREYLFSGLVQSLEYYQGAFIKEKKISYVKKIGRKIDKIADSLPKKDRGQLKDIFNEYYHPPFIKRIEVVFEEYSDIAKNYFKFKTRKAFCERVTDTRHYYTHWTKRPKKKPAKGKALFLLTKDLQLLMQMCIMRELGISKENLRMIYRPTRT